MFELKKGCLYVVATPIGNLSDLSPRARDVLAQVDLICAEDTRHTRQLLNAVGLEKSLLALHEHNESERVAQILAQLQSGKCLALVSDAGTPLISDPGYRLVRELRAAGIVISPIPGPCAAIAALSVAGIASDRFSFEGFLPHKASARRERLQGLAGESRTLVFYESSHRIEECLADMRAAFGDGREAVLAREISKLFETVLDGTLASIAGTVAADPNQRKGEFVLVIAGAPEDENAALREGRRLYAKLVDVLKPSQAAKIAADLSGASRKDLYGGE
ncbi:MAG: 16S rRNA (cytidine(1402)-2'-O)-methyltransferase [Arenimonas sp.]|nr:16S rRNA (cytidine(1402)-2'-O)-methyltransferase [Arenimonas sp.]MBP7981723.1 16S rRNA (cytidine(1402)-2'-O)-methyltransferase [Arenimonas sp.]